MQVHERHPSRSGTEPLSGSSLSSPCVPAGDCIKWPHFGREKRQGANLIFAGLLPLTWEFHLEQSPVAIEFFFLFVFFFSPSILKMQFADLRASRNASLYCCCGRVCVRVGGCNQTSEANSVDPRSKKKGLNQISQCRNTQELHGGCVTRQSQTVAHPCHPSRLQKLMARITIKAKIRR